MAIRVDPVSRAKLYAIRRAVALVPPTAPVTATNRIGAHLSQRPRIFIFPVRADAEWVVVDTSDAWLASVGEDVDPKLFDAELAGLRPDTAWRRVFDEEGVLVCRRAAPGGPEKSGQRSTA